VRSAQAAEAPFEIELGPASGTFPRIIPKKTVDMVFDKSFPLHTVWILESAARAKYRRGFLLKYFLYRRVRFWTQYSALLTWACEAIMNNGSPADRRSCSSGFLSGLIPGEKGKLLSVFITSQWKIVA
jgi:hypothetical protein